MDLRIQKTRNSIYEAFIELRGKKSLEKITIKELTDKAKISKQTFYLHYKDIYDLSEHLEKELLDTMMEGISFPDNLLKHAGEITLQLFSHIIDQGHLFKIIFSGSRQAVLINSIEKIFKSALYIKQPELRADLKTNIYITVLVQGCYNAYEQYSTIDQERVVSILSEICESITESYMA